MCPSHFCRVSVTSPSSQSDLKFFRAESSHKNCRVIGLQARVNVESHEIWHFFYDIFCTMKWRPRCCKMVPEKLENGAQYWFNKFDCRLFISKFSQFEVYLILSLSVISKSLAQPCCKCCNLSVSIVLNVQFTTNGMCVKNHTHVYVVRTSWNRMSTMWDL